MPRLPCQYEYRNTINWWHFCIQWLPLVYVPTNYFHVADQSFYTNASGCTDQIYHADLDMLWVLAWESQAQGGQWSRCVIIIITFSNMFTWKFLVGRLSSCAVMMKPSILDFRPDKASHWWFSEEFTSGPLARIGYLPCRGLSFHSSFSLLIFLVFVLICFCFSVNEKFSGMSVLRLISIKYFLHH